MSILASILIRLAKRHQDKVRKKYKHRHLRPLNFFRGAVLQGRKFDDSGEIFTEKFFDELKDEMKETNSYVWKCTSYFFLISFLIFSAHVGAEVSVIWVGIKLGDILVFSDFLTILAGVCLCLSAIGMVKSSSLYNIIEEYVDVKIQEKNKVFLAEATKALWLSKYGGNFFDYPSQKIVMKGKYIYEPYKLRRFVDRFGGLSFDVLFVSLVVFWGVVTFITIQYPPISLYVSIVSFVGFWVFSVVAGVVVFMYFCVLTGILAKGVKEPTDSEQSDGQLEFEDF